MVKALVTGASGMIGAAAVIALRQQHVDVVATSRTRPSRPVDGVAYVSADLSDPQEAAELVRQIRPTHILHAAWETRQPTYWSDPVNLDWVFSTGAMAKAFGECGGTCFVQVGSCAEYSWSDGLCREDVTPDRPATRYGKAKLSAYHAIATAGQDRFVSVDARIFFVYGPYENPARLIPYICRSHLTGRMPALSSGVQTRDLLHVDDAAAALSSLLLQDRLSGVVNIGAGAGTRLASVAELLAEIAGADATGIGSREDRTGDPHLLIAASERLRSTGWQPSHDLRSGLASTFEWWAEALKEGDQ